MTLIPALALLFLPVQGDAAFSVPGYELVYSYPAETTLNEPDLRQAAEVWPAMFDAAQKKIDVEQFYVTPSTGAGLDPILEPSLEALERAGRRGVHIRVLLERKFAHNSIWGVERLVNIPHLELRFLDWSDVGKTGRGIIHAKFFTVDASSGPQAYVGSQNFDWRALDQIHELGLAVSDKPVVQKIQSVFDRDWRLAGSVDWATPARPKRPGMDRGRRAYLVASPWRYNPDGVGDSEAELVRQIGRAKSELLVQMYDYLPLTFAGGKPYTIIDDALRKASARGVKIKLLLDVLSGEPRRHAGFLRNLALSPGVEIRFISVPEASRGHIDFARVFHSKYMVVDGKSLWLGTSNWAGGYLDDSRNLELVVKDEALAARAAAMHKHLWDSTYAKPLAP